MLSILLYPYYSIHLYDYDIITNKSRSFTSDTHFKMPSLRKVLGAMAVGMVSVTSAFPAVPRLSPRLLNMFNLAARQNPATGLPDGLTDVDILQL